MAQDEDGLRLPPTVMRVGGAPGGHDARLLIELVAEHRGPVLYVGRQDRRMAEMADAVAFHDPTLPIIELPAWDCQPYDRISPHPEVVARRMAALTKLAGGVSGPAVVLTTVNAMLQRLVPRGRVLAGTWSAGVGDRADMDALARQLVECGYVRTEAVGGPGEFAVRGGIIDVYGPGMEWPLRLEFAWDHLESVRQFDSLDQRTVDTVGAVEIVLAGEASLDMASVERFRERYREQFGLAQGTDPLYTAVSEGRRHQGMEHWLPFFHEQLETLFDYLPGVPVVLDELSEHAVVERQALIADLYESRLTSDTEAESEGATVYKPCPPELLYLATAEWVQGLESHSVRQFLLGDVPEGENTVDGGGRSGRSFATERMAQDVDLMESVVGYIDELRQGGSGVLVTAATSGSLERMASALREAGCEELRTVSGWSEFESMLPETPAAIAVWGLPAGYRTARYAVLTEEDIFGDRLVSRTTRARRPQDHLREAEELAPGDYVVHTEYGLGLFRGLEASTVGDIVHDCVVIEYNGGDLLRLPVENIDMLFRYGEGQPLALDRLGSGGWQTRKARARNRIEKLAEDLIRTAAERELRSAPALQASEGGYSEFCARFPFEETDDQLTAVNDTLTDLAAGRPMDRLVCGDVGYGKTEVALRAAFAVVNAGGQVAVIAPTTLLARQHHRTFEERFRGFPVKVAQLSRFVSAAEAARVRQGLTDGSIDICIGTHALLARSVQFANLRLAVIDEEQQFGVAQKEKLKSLRSDMHVLAMSATPIPRTLQLALSGIRPMSVIATPPVDRLAVRAYVMPFDPLPLREALLREHYRGGQSFFVVPRIADLDTVAKFVRERVPELRFVVAHGQLSSADLGQRMNAFYDGAYDLLVSTSIIASGLDIPRANTLVVHHADRFGLAQLYQIRGRVGRSKHRAYAYFTTDPRYPLTPAAQHRLAAVSAMDDFGAGFALASRDLDIRGAGNLLGSEQAGHIREVGTELYREMLEDAVRRLRTGIGDDVEEEELDLGRAPRIDLGLSVAIPESYVPDLGTRLTLYRRLAALPDASAVEGMAAEIHDRFGPPPDEVETLYRVLQLKSACKRTGIATMDVGAKGVKLTFRRHAIQDPAALVGYVTENQSTMRLRPDGSLLIREEFDPAADRVEVALGICRDLSELTVGGRTEQEVADGNC